MMHQLMLLLPQITHNFFSFFLWKSVGSTVLFTFFKISSSFVFSRRKKFIQVWNNLRVSMMTEFSFLGKLSF